MWKITTTTHRHNMAESCCSIWFIYCWTGDIYALFNELNWTTHKNWPYMFQCTKDFIIGRTSIIRVTVLIEVSVIVIEIPIVNEEQWVKEVDDISIDIGNFFPWYTRLLMLLIMMSVTTCFSLGSSSSYHCYYSFFLVSQL